MARGLIAAMSRPSCQAAPLRASVEKDLRELLGVVLHVRIHGLFASQVESGQAGETGFEQVV
jgi:hypothetical protein